MNKGNPIVIHIFQRYNTKFYVYNEGKNQN